MSSNTLLSRFAGEPALIEPAQQARFEACLAAASQHPLFDKIMASPVRSDDDQDDDDFWADDDFDSDDDWRSALRPYVVVNGILQIPVKGVLLNNFPYQLFDWATGYEYIYRAFQRGCGDYATGVIKGIAFVEDTPGGMVAGCFDAVDKMVALKEKVGVPVQAFAHESAYSAGYAIATVADKIVVSRTGGVGSVGVVTSHTDVSGAMSQAGIKITFIASDPSKVEGNSYEPLSDDAKSRLQARIDELYDIFVAAVVRGRGLSEKAIREDLKAYCYTATQAVSNGLADAIGTLEDATAAFAADLDDPSDDNDGEDDMTNKVATVEQAVHDQAVAEARAEGAAAERTRIGAILGSAEAADRRSLAEHFAFKTDMSVEAVEAALAASPKAAAAAPALAAAAPAPVVDLSAAMEATTTPGQQVRGSIEPSGNVDDKDDATALIAFVQSAGISGYKRPKN